MPVCALVVAEDPDVLGRLQSLVTSPNVLCQTASSLTDVEARISQSGIDVAVLTRALLGPASSQTIRRIRSLPGAPDVVVISESQDDEERARLTAAGCAAVVPLRIEDDLLRGALQAVMERRNRVQPPGLEGPGRPAPRLDDFESESPAMQSFLKVVRRVAASDSSLLVLGETGVGKEWLARAIHAESRRAHGPLIAINCGAFPESLLESELFGHEKGAFTGAARVRKGWFEVAHGGTLFLDEIGEMPSHLQVRLLRVLQEREVSRIGGEKAIPVNVRIIAATNRNIESEVESGRFRRDLYYRLNVVSLAIPPLRERKEDLPALAARFLEDLRSVIASPAERLSEPALRSLLAYTWPGNVRELLNVLERATLLCEGPEVTLEELPESIRFAADVAGAERPAPRNEERMAELAALLGSEPLPVARRAAVAAFERAYLTRLLEETGGKIAETARRAGIQPRSLFERMRHYGLRKEDFRQPRGGTTARE